MDRLPKGCSSQNVGFFESYQKPTDQKSNFHAKSEHPSALKKYRIQPDLDVKSYMF